MSIPTTLRGYDNGSLTQKDDGLKHPHHRFMREELHNMNSIYAFNRFEEKGHIQHFQCHFRLVNIPSDVFYALALPAIQERPR